MRSALRAAGGSEACAVARVVGQASPGHAWHPWHTEVFPRHCERPRNTCHAPDKTANLGTNRRVCTRQAVSNGLEILGLP